MMDYLRMLRLSDWIKFYPAMPMAGALLAGASLSRLAMIFLIYASAIGYAFAVNNYFDVDIDRLHSIKVESNKNPLASGKIGYRGVQVLMFLLIGFSGLSIAMSLTGFCLVMLNLLLFTAYSESRLRLKERTGLDIITHGLMFGMVPFLAGFALDQGSISPRILYVSTILFMLACEALIAHQVVDYEMDIKSTKTTVTRIGQRKGLMLLGIFTLTSIAILLDVSGQSWIPSWAVVLLGCYILAYPAYSCRGILRDFRHNPSAQ